MYGLFLVHYCRQATPTTATMHQLSGLFRSYSFVLIPLWCYTGFSTASLHYIFKDDLVDRLRPYRIAYGWFTFVAYWILAFIAMLRNLCEAAASS